MISSFNSHFISSPNKHDDIINNVIIDPDFRNHSVKNIYGLNDQVCLGIPKSAFWDTL